MHATWVVVLLLVGCPEDGEPRATGTLSHAEALGVARAIHSAAIDQATFARSRLERGMVEALADLSLEEHRRALEELQRVADARGLAPTESETSLTLRQDALERLEALEDERGRELAEDFLENQLEFHRRALDVVDRELLAATSQDRELLESMTELRRLLADHVDLARDVQRQEEHRGRAGRPEER